MPTTARPSVLLFDVNETLIDIGPVKERVAQMLNDPQAPELWFSMMLQYALVATVAGQYFSFPETGAAVLQMIGHNRDIAIGADEARATLAMMKTSPAHQDVAPALTRLKAAGFRLATVTNSPQEGVKAQLQSGGISHFFEREISVESVRKFKPHADVYAAAARAMQAAPADCMLVAAHGWDVAGAQWAGMRTAFIGRPGQQKFPLAPEPEMEAADLLALAELLGA